MGAINYKTSKFLTLGVNPAFYDFETIKKDYLNNLDYYGMDADEITENFINDQIAFYYECDRENAENILNNYDFNIFSVGIEPGYYEGFSINIDFDWLYFDDSNEKRDAQKELTKLKKCLIDLTNGAGLVVCFPGWCTGYLDYENTLNQINEAIKDAREYIRKIPTYYTKYIKNAKEA